MELAILGSSWQEMARDLSAEVSDSALLRWVEFGVAVLGANENVAVAAKVSRSQPVVLRMSVSVDDHAESEYGCELLHKSGGSFSISGDNARSALTLMAANMDSDGCYAPFEIEHPDYLSILTIHRLGGFDRWDDVLAAAGQL